jgi:hypothetical protein
MHLLLTTMINHHHHSVLLLLLVTLTAGFQSPTLLSGRANPIGSTPKENQEDLTALLLERFPTSIDDQVRQATAALKRASLDGNHRHSIRLLLPLIGASDLDDWPGGTRQMAEAATPLMKTVLQGMGALQLSTAMIDESDGIGAIMTQAEDPKEDSCTVLLPTADTIKALQSLEKQVGPGRDLILVNTQWNRQSDFGFFGRGEQVQYVEKFSPSFYCSNLMVEGEQVRILRSYPGPWRVFVRVVTERNSVEWRQVGDKPVLETKPASWDKDPANARDGGKIFDYGCPSYKEIETMIVSQDWYQPKSFAERAAAAFTFIKDTL